MIVDMAPGNNFVLQPNPKPLKITLLDVCEEGTVRLLVTEEALEEQDYSEVIGKGTGASCPECHKSEVRKMYDAFISPSKCYSCGVTFRSD